MHGLTSECLGKCPSLPLMLLIANAFDSAQSPVCACACQVGFDPAHYLGNSPPTFLKSTGTFVHTKLWQARGACSSFTLMRVIMLACHPPQLTTSTTFCPTRRSPIPTRFSPIPTRHLVIVCQDAFGARTLVTQTAS